MSRKLIALDLALLAMLAWAGHGLRQMWLSARAREAAELHRKVGSVPVAPLSPLPNAPAVVPAKYKNIADKFLLDKSRNPDVPVEPPPPPPPEPPMPKLPVYHGLMNLGDGVTAFLSVAPGSAYEMVHPGESIGEFKLLSVNTREIDLEWHGKKVHKMVDELMDRTQSSDEQQQAASAARSSIAAAAAPPPAAKLPEPPSEKGPGQRNSLGTAPCQQNDTTPFGTVRDGMRKVDSVTPFGHVCLWESLGGGGK